MGDKKMKKTITIMILTICVGISFTAETDVNSSITVKKVGDKTLDEAEYWVIRSQALTELTPLLTRTRREAKGHYRALTDYIKYIEKGEEFLKSSIKAPSSPAEYAKLIGKAEEFEKRNIKLPEKYMTWDQLIELAMEFVLFEGHIPTDLDGPEEIEMFKQICERKEKYGKKVQTELRKIAQDCMDMKAYLDSIDEFEACVKYTRYQKEEKEKAKEERIRKVREDAIAKKKRLRELEKKNIWLNRQRRLSDSYYRGRYR